MKEREFPNIQAGALFDDEEADELGFIKEVIKKEY
jgi:hypothetical protein